MNERMNERTNAATRSCSPCEIGSVAATSTRCGLVGGWLVWGSANYARICTIVCSASYYYHYYCLLLLLLFVVFGALLLFGYCVACSALLPVVVLPATRCRSSIGALVWQFRGLAVADTVWFYFGFDQLCAEIRRLTFSIKKSLFFFFILWREMSSNRRQLLTSNRLLRVFLDTSRAKSMACSISIVFRKIKAECF